MDVPHRFFTLSTDLHAGGELDETVLGRQWLVISTLALLAVSAAVFLVS